MRDVSDRLRRVLASGVYSVEWTADLYYGGEPKAQNLSILGPRFAWDAAAQVQGSGQCTILWDDLFGQSVAPREIGDLFSPFGAELQVDVVVSAGAFRERVSMGRFVLDSVPASVEYAIRNPLGVSRKPVYTDWVEQRRNLNPTPIISASTAGWLFNGGSLTHAPVAGGREFTVTAAIPAGTYMVGTPNGYSTIGDTIAFRVEVRNTSAQSISVAATVATNTAPVGASVTIPAGESRVIQHSRVLNTAGFAARLAAGVGGVPAGVKFVVLDGWTTEKASSVDDAFTGSTNPSGILERTRWLGTPNASVSVLETRVQVGVEETTLGTVPVVAESTVTLDLADYFLRIARDSFPFPESPKSTSMWDEAQRLTGLPVFRSIPDRVLPTNITYDEDRLEALGKAFGPSNAWPALTPVGALTARPKDWPAPVGRIENVIDITAEMRSENVYNRVVVEGKNPNPDGPALIAVAEVTDGFLRVRNQDGSRSPFGGNTYRYSSEFLTTQAQCQAYANDLLPRVSRLRSVTRTVTVPFDPLVEIGDVTTLVDPTRQGEESTVRVRSVAHEDTETKLVVEVQDAP